MKKLCAAVIVLLWSGFLPAASFEAAAAKDVPFVPTPDEVVAEMLRLAEVGAGDVLYDLGCGDGRIVVTAARERGARGVGIDIDPERIRESRILAERSKVTDRVSFRQQDLFEVDMREASVVTLYLLPDVNVRLRPKLLAQLKPGTRVVSHDFDMREWKPDQVTRMDGHTLYFWRIPANATGTWEWTRSSSRGEERWRLAIEQKFQQVSGTLTEGSAALPIRDASVSGDRLRFVVDGRQNGRLVPVTYEGKIRGDALQGVRRVADNPGAEEWQAARDPKTRKALEE